MSLSKAQKIEWQAKVQEGVFFLVGVEIHNERKGTFINLLRHFAGNLKGVPKIEKGIKGKGHFAKGMVVDEFIKTQYDAGCMLKDAPPEVIDSIVEGDGVLHTFIKNLFVDAYFKTNYVEIYAGVKHWTTIKSLINSVNPEQALADAKADVDAEIKEKGLRDEFAADVERQET